MSFQEKVRSLTRPISVHVLSSSALFDTDETYVPSVTDHSIQKTNVTVAASSFSFHQVANADELLPDIEPSDHCRDVTQSCLSPSCVTCRLFIADVKTANIFPAVSAITEGNARN